MRNVGKELKVVSVSGGKDSTALYCLCVEYYGNDFLPIFADTGNEHPVTINYVRNLHLMAGGPEVVIVKSDFTKQLQRKGIKPTGIPFLDLMLWKGRAPSTKAQFCTEWVKLWAIKCYLEEHRPYDDYVMFIGIRAGESEKRAKRQPFNINDYFDCDEVLPMLYESEENIFSYLESKGVPPNPLYTIQGANRVGCYPCIHANKTQLRGLEDWAWEKLKDWEDRIDSSWFSSGILPRKSKGYIPRIDEVRNWCMTSRGGRQYNLLATADHKDVPSCMSSWGICE
ncbi:hypothetical protein D3C80_923890 [compost metagenome]